MALLIILALLVALLVGLGFVIKWPFILAAIAAPHLVNRILHGPGSRVRDPRGQALLDAHVSTADARTFTLGPASHSRAPDHPDWMIRDPSLTRLAFVAPRTAAYRTGRDR